MKNSAPNHFIWANIFKKAPTYEEAHPPSDTPCVAQARQPVLTPICDFQKSAPPHFENRSAAYER